MKITVAACQQLLHEPLSSIFLNEISSKKIEFVCLPEHYPLSREIQTLSQAASLFQERKQYLADLSSKLAVAIIGGTLTESAAGGYYNTCYVFDSGEEIGFYRKVHPTLKEQDAGVMPGNEFKIFKIRGVEIGVLICADVLNAASFSRLSSLGCRVAFIPTASPYRPGETVQEKLHRDHSIFLEGARRMGCPLVKTCGVGTTFGHPIQGRSLIVTPETILLRAEPHQEHESILLTATLDV